VTLPAAGIVLVDKPAGWTSHDVVAVTRRLLGTRRVGHGGTLDPFATGLLPLLYGTATRLSEYLHGAPKSYLAEIVLGRETSTGDLTGEPLEDAPVPELADSGVRDAFSRFLGPQSQTPPAFSAVKVGGQRAYEKARRGEAVSLPARRIEIHEFELVERAERCLHVLVTCSAGTYVRSLARDVGRALGTRGHLGALRRLTVGSFSVEDAVSVEDLRRLGSEGALETVVHPADIAVLGLSAVVVAPSAARLLRHGQTIPAQAEAGPLRVYAADGAFVGIAIGGDGRLRPRTIFPAVEGDAAGVQGG
jgi:tRNA pseudouridine55 synthase